MPRSTLSISRSPCLLRTCPFGSQVMHVRDVKSKAASSVERSKGCEPPLSRHRSMLWPRRVASPACWPECAGTHMRSHARTCAGMRRHAHACTGVRVRAPAGARRPRRAQACMGMRGHARARPRAHGHVQGCAGMGGSAQACVRTRGARTRARAHADACGSIRMHAMRTQLTRRPQPHDSSVRRARTDM